ncbi:MAG: hypothetical protein K2Y22_03090 [Candidatus Obscuribacterales bacterium]|nr:hypothetical protein [Candidatus Obscuribacterales bacterium]
MFLIDEKRFLIIVLGLILTSAFFSLRAEAKLFPCVVRFFAEEAEVAPHLVTDGSLNEVPIWMMTSDITCLCTSKTFPVYSTPMQVAFTIGELKKTLSPDNAPYLVFTKADKRTRQLVYAQSPLSTPERTLIEFKPVGNDWVLDNYARVGNKLVYSPYPHPARMGEGGRGGDGCPGQNGGRGGGGFLRGGPGGNGGPGTPTMVPGKGGPGGLGGTKGGKGGTGGNAFSAGQTGGKGGPGGDANEPGGHGGSGGDGGNGANGSCHIPGGAGGDSGPGGNASKLSGIGGDSGNGGTGGSGRIVKIRKQKKLK